MRYDEKRGFSAMIVDRANFNLEWLNKESEIGKILKK